MTKWVVYGYRTTGLILPGQKQNLGRAGVHAEHLTSAEQAVLFLTRQVVKFGANVHAVVVELPNDVDDCDRKVIHRAGNGKAWWE